MRKFYYSKEELEKIAEMHFLTNLQVDLIKYRQLDYSIVKMSDLTKCSIRTIGYEFEKIDKKLKNNKTIQK